MEAKFKELACKACDGSGFVMEWNGAWIRQVRESEGLGLREVARKLEISASFLSDIELGKRKPNDKIIKFFEAFTTNHPTPTREVYGNFKEDCKKYKMVC